MTTTARTTSTMHAAALEYITGVTFGRPVAIFPLPARSKSPSSTVTPHGHLDATADRNRIDAWWTEHPDANIGLPLEMNGLCAIDLDGQTGLDQFIKLDPNTHPADLTCCVQTGSGGAHLIYKVPPGRNARGTAGVRQNIDLRGPGYLVAAGSVHPNGNKYLWVVTPRKVPPAVAPEWILKPITPTTRQNAAEPPPEGFHTAYGRQSLIGIVDDMANAQPGTRNHMLYAKTRRVVDLVLSGDVQEGNALHVLRLAAEHSGLPTHEVERTMRSALGGGADVN
jgi:hypothetical protein